MASSRARTAALVAQGFALLATLVGIFTIIVGVGPRTVPDVIYHVAIVAVLAWGFVVAKRAREHDLSGSYDDAPAHEDLTHRR